MTAYGRAEEIWFRRYLKMPDKEKASERQLRSLIKQHLNTNNIIRLDKARTALGKQVSPSTLSAIVNEYEHAHFKRVGINTALPEDTISDGGNE